VEDSVVAGLVAATAEDLAEEDSAAAVCANGARIVSRGLSAPGAGT
jgi:hypothetical protein